MGRVWTASVVCAGDAVPELPKWRRMIAPPHSVGVTEGNRKPARGLEIGLAFP